MNYNKQKTKSKILSKISEILEKELSPNTFIDISINIKSGIDKLYSINRTEKPLIIKE